jgi:hypothetical protein
MRDTSLIFVQFERNCEAASNFYHHRQKLATNFSETPRKLWANCETTTLQLGEKLMRAFLRRLIKNQVLFTKLFSPFILLRDRLHQW